jgi:hypothetical protein
MRDSSGYLSSPDFEHLRKRLHEDGYLYLPGLLPRPAIHLAFVEFLDQLEIKDAASLSKFMSRFNRKAITAADRRRTLIRESSDLEPGPATKLPEIQKLHDVMSGLLGGPIRLLNRTLFRVVATDGCTLPHSDTVYAGRGSGPLLTCWIPLVDVPITKSPIMILAGSNQMSNHFGAYWKTDHDKHGNWRRLRFRHGRFFSGSAYSVNARRVQSETNRRWLTTSFMCGDVLIFDSRTIHCALENRSERARFSMDARYQLASDSPDPRWTDGGQGRHDPDDPRIYGILDLLGIVGRNFVRGIRKRIK